MKQTILTACTVALMATACSSGSSDVKRLVIMSSGKIQAAGKDAKEITFEPGTQHNEMEFQYVGKDTVKITVKSKDGDKTYDLPESGAYVLNLKSADTLIGSIVNYGDAGMPKSISTEQLQHMVDSTQQLIMGLNASDAARTYFLVPFAIKKISPIYSAKLIGPFNGIPNSVEVGKDGKAPEVYKFATTKQKREDLYKLVDRMNK
ncbi:MAG: hypothetical protein J7578_03640 [Chitinophagaceae bacterium]|nr:hypothetical protein [Chitinophagaceae bacterium]